MKKVNTELWNRKHAHGFYTSFEDPVYSITAKVDILALYTFCKEKQIRIYPAYLYASQLAVNRIREFKMRFIQNEVYEFDEVHCAPTVAAPDHTFRFSVFKMQPTFSQFLLEFEAKTAKALLKEELDLSYPYRDTIYYTVVPWIHFTGFKNPNLVANEDTPRIAFGKILIEPTHAWMPVAVEAHHGILDGYHIGQYFEYFQDLLNHPEQYMND